MRPDTALSTPLFAISSMLDSINTRCILDLCASVTKLSKPFWLDVCLFGLLSPSGYHDFFCHCKGWSDERISSIPDGLYQPEHHIAFKKQSAISRIGFVYLRAIWGSLSTEDVINNHTRASNSGTSPREVNVSVWRHFTSTRVLQVCLHSYLPPSLLRTNADTESKADLT